MVASWRDGSWGPFWARWDLPRARDPRSPGFEVTWSAPFHLASLSLIGAIKSLHAASSLGGLCLFGFRGPGRLGGRRRGGSGSGSGSGSLNGLGGGPGWGVVGLGSRSWGRSRGRGRGRGTSKAFGFSKRCGSLAHGVLRGDGCRGRGAVERSVLRRLRARSSGDL